MSLGIIIKGPEGVVLASDSRLTLEAIRDSGETMALNFDNATKLFGFSDPHNFFGVVTYGLAAIGNRPAHSFVPELEVQLINEKRQTIHEYASRIGKFFMEKWRETMSADYAGPSMVFVVGGYDKDDAYGKVFLIKIPNEPIPEERNPGETFGMTWGGQIDLVSRIIQGYDPHLLPLLKQHFNLSDEAVAGFANALRQNVKFTIPYNVLPLQDCVDLAVFMIDATKAAQGLSIGLRGVGGPTDVAVVTRSKGLEFINRKSIHS